MRILAIAATFAALSGSAAGQSVAVKPALSGLAFLTGNWSSGRGTVSETGGSSTGASRFTVEAGGAVLLRQDRTNLFDRAGKPVGSFEQIMMIYPESGTLHADYADGTHVIHYTSARIVPGKSVVFSSAPSAGAPVFQLAYTLAAPNKLDVAFGMAPPGQAGFRPIATGSLVRNP